MTVLHFEMVSSRLN